MSASRLVRAAQGQVIGLLNQIEKMSEHISALQSENDRLTAQSTAKSAQIADLLWVLADIAETATEAATDPDPDLHNLREQISRYVTGMEIRSRASAPPLL